MLPASRGQRKEKHSQRTWSTVGKSRSRFDSRRRTGLRSPTSTAASGSAAGTHAGAFHTQRHLHGERSAPHGETLRKRPENAAPTARRSNPQPPQGSGTGAGLGGGSKAVPGQRAPGARLSIRARLPGAQQRRRAPPGSSLPAPRPGSRALPSRGPRPPAASGTGSSARGRAPCVGRGPGAPSQRPRPRSSRQAPSPARAGAAAFRGPAAGTAAPASPPGERRRGAALQPKPSRGAGPEPT